MDFPLCLALAPAGSRCVIPMMRKDLGCARAVWIEEAKTDVEKKRREKSDFLRYQDEDGLYADFHANRHTFITNLAKAGVHPKMAQTVARHSDVNLTMGIYSHVGVSDQAAAINSLPAPPVPKRVDHEIPHAPALDNTEHQNDAEKKLSK